MLFSVITKNLNWEISTTNLVTLVNRWDEVKDENFNMGILWKIWLLGGFTKNQYIGGEIVWKGGGGLGQFVDLRVGGAWQKRGVWWFWGGGWYPYAHCGVGASVLDV